MCQRLLRVLKKVLFEYAVTIRVTAIILRDTLRKVEYLFLFGFLKVFFGMTKEKVCVLIFILT